MVQILKFQPRRQSPSVLCERDAFVTMLPISRRPGLVERHADRCRSMKSAQAEAYLAQLRCNLNAYLEDRGIVGEESEKIQIEFFSAIDRARNGPDLAINTSAEATQ